MCYERGVASGLSSEEELCWNLREDFTREGVSLNYKKFTWKEFKKVAKRNRTSSEFSLYEYIDAFASNAPREIASDAARLFKDFYCGGPEAIGCILESRMLSSNEGANRTVVREALKLLGAEFRRMKTAAVIRWYKTALALALDDDSNVVLDAQVYIWSIVKRLRCGAFDEVYRNRHLPMMIRLESFERDLELLPDKKWLPGEFPLCDSDSYIRGKTSRKVLARADALYKKVARQGRFL